MRARAQHEEVYRIVDNCANIRDKAMVLLSYHSGLKGNGISNLKIKHVKPVLEHYKETKELPLIIKVTHEIYPKRFRTYNMHLNFYPAMLDKDAVDMLLKYYEKYRKDADDEEYFFVTRDNRRLTQARLSKQIRMAIDRASITTKELGKDTYAMLLRDSFYNRLIRGNMRARAFLL